MKSLLLLYRNAQVLCITKVLREDLTVFMVCLTEYDCKDTKNNLKMQAF
nr:MAG TPA: hypothetical protein [Caudoviricetes sp.]